MYTYGFFTAFARDLIMSDQFRGAIRKMWASTQFSGRYSVSKLKLNDHPLGTKRTSKLFRRPLA